MTAAKHDFQDRTMRMMNPGRVAVIIAVCLLAICCPVMATNTPMASVLCEFAMADTGEAKNLEYQLKAAFLYNFMKFIEWSESPSASDGKEAEKKEKEPVILAVMGEDLFGKHLDDLTKKMIKDRPVRIVRLEGFEQYKEAHSKATLEQYFQEQQKVVEGCQLLFVSQSEEEWMDKILAFTDGMRIITVGDAADFASKGGVIGFVMEENKIRFDINMLSAEKKKLKVSSQLLQLARKIYKKQQ
jgi:hypothetical protein